MKHLTTSLLTAVAVLAVASQFTIASAAALPPPFNDYGVDLALTGGVSGSYNSNVLSAPGGPTKFEDYIATFTPGLGLEWGKNAVTDVNFNFTETFTRYLNHSSLNDELSNVGLDVVRKQGAFTLSGAVGFVQAATNTPSSAGLLTVPGLIRSDVISASGNVHYDMSDKFNFNAGLAWVRTSYLYSVGAAFQNSDSYSVPASVYYVYSQELSFGLAYAYSQTDQKNSIATPSSIGRERDSHTVSLNAQLTKWQKLTGSANVGYTINRIAADSSTASPSLTTPTFVYGLGLQYDYSEKIAFTLNGTRNFTTGVSGQNVENTGAGLGLIYTYSPQITVNANLLTLNWSQYKQTNRDDWSKATGVTVSWKPLDYLTVSAAYAYFMNSSYSSPSQAATYNQNIISLTASVHY